MRYDLTYLTFLTDPTTYQAHTDEVCVRVPVGTFSAEELMGFLKENLGLPAYFGASWYALRDALGYWYNSEATPWRVVIIHTDVPFLQSGKLWWLDLQGYLLALIESIAFLKRKNAAETDPLKHRELVVIFPEQMEEEIRAVFNRPPDWELTLGFVGYDVFNIYEIDPPWSLVLHYLTQLNGLTAEVCTLSRKQLGSINVQYVKSMNAYCVKYQSPDKKTSLVASPSEGPSFPPVVSFSLASQILETFFNSSQRLDSLIWSTLSDEASEILKEILERSYYQSDEEALLERFMVDATYSTIGEGVKEAVYSGENAFSLEYWQSIPGQSEATLTQRLAAICVIGRSGLPGSAALLHPFLQSTMKQERWVSARFFGLWGDEEALPILLNMLIDELPTDERTQKIKQDGYWYDTWRLYAPRLLRKWQIPEVGEHLRQALATWVLSEAQFDPDIEVWKRPEEEICYELGYRGEISVLQSLSLEYEHQQELENSLKQGYKVREKQLTPQQEYIYRKSPWAKHDFMK